MKTLIRSTLLAVIGIATMPTAHAGEIWRATGLEQPESAFFDAAGKRIIVSNIVGNPSEADGNGYLSILSLDGKMVAQHWTDGMDAPKGMAISGGMSPTSRKSASSISKTASSCRPSMCRIPSFSTT
ncbi:hypothetical protein [Mesorhizobium sp.]|uniref:hypothetical protein n=1 Tax=Mesorhizobium sp. TaxID=1871066 RepID=UPI0025D9307E|nr:hypothetical protein [Mesorhizobium sp.]